MKYLFPFLAILALATMACGFAIPSVPTPGPEVTDEIMVAGPEAGETRLKLQFGAGELNLSPGSEEVLVEGTATYSYPNFKPTILENENEVVIKQDDFKTINVSDIKNEWNLTLGETPMDLEINAGAYQGNFEFGGLALTDLTIKDGASDVDISFSESNLTKMSVFRYETGASSVTLNELANANFATMFFNAGAGDYTLDFNGDFQRDATVRIETGFNDLTLVIPEEMNAKVTVEGGAINITHSSGWAQSGHEYTQKGNGPILTVIIKIGAGNVTITD